MEDIQKREYESQSEYIERIINGIFVDKTIPTTEYENLSELIFGDGNCFNSSEVRKRLYGMKYLLDIQKQEQYNYGVSTRILSISDSHVPFNLPIETYKDFIGRVDILQLNGDIIDMQAISKFSKAYRVSVMEEIIQGRQYIIDLIEYIKPKKVVANYGNHELRFQNYLSKNLDSDLLELMPQTALDLIFVDGFNHYDKRTKSKVNYEPLVKVFKDIEIEYTGNWFNQIGETIFCHPSAFSTGILKTAEKALYYFRNEGYNFTSLVMAHTHRIGDYVVGNTTIFEQGAGCDTKKQHYSDGRLTYSQKEGFIYVCQDKDGKIIRDKTQLVCLN